MLRDWFGLGLCGCSVPSVTYARVTNVSNREETTMNQPLATFDRTICGGWRVPVGSVLRDEIKDCDHCGHGVNVLTVRTAEGSVVMADSIYDRADEDTTICAACLRGLED